MLSFKQDDDLAQFMQSHASIYSIPCPVCGAKHSFIKYGSYQRTLLSYVNDKVISTTLTIQRVQCTSCSSTHALLPMSIIPHSSFGFYFTISLLYDYFTHHYPTVEILCEHYTISVSTLYRIVNRFFQDRKLMIGLMLSAIKSMTELLISLKNWNFLPSMDPLNDYYKATGVSFLQPRCNFRLNKHGSDPPLISPT